MRRYKHFHRKEKKKEVKGLLFVIREILVTVGEAVAVVALAWFIVRSALLKTPVIDSSMEPTLKQGTMIIVDKVRYRFTGPKRMDVIVYKQAGREHSYLEMSRVLGLPGETIRIKNGIIYINDSPLKETLAVETITNSGLAEDGVTLGNDEYFVLGDNRNNSEDSRFANVGNIIKSDIIGKAVATEKPFAFVSGLNLLENEKKSSEAASGSSVSLSKE
ncbi:MAG: signal peptidase I [Catonella sp.]|jgi:signal peptidase I|nr:signal peptidase I [Catonella sp.]MDY6355905.1 signal peptidase I [Catonella sp.]